MDQYKQFPHPLRCPVLRAAWPRHTDKGCLCLQEGTGNHLCLYQCVCVSVCTCVCVCACIHACKHVCVCGREKQRKIGVTENRCGFSTASYSPHTAHVRSIKEKVNYDFQSVILQANKHHINKVILQEKHSFMLLSF